MKAGRLVALVVVCLAASGCFRQVVQTGRTPGPIVIDMPWTNSFFWGLVAPAPIDVSAQCQSGLATVVTEQSFMNGLVSLLTLGIYSPRHVTITCATGSALRPGLTEIHVADASIETQQRALTQAIDESNRLGQPVVLRF
jgi:hypothetical protein